MTGTPAIIVLLATILLGALCGIQWLMGTRRPVLVNAHLIAALIGVAVVLAAVLAPPAARAGGGPAGFVPPLLVALAVVAGWSARRVARRVRRGGDVLLVAHVFLGLGGFLVLLAWLRAP